MKDTALKIQRIFSPRDQRRRDHFDTPENAEPATDWADPGYDGISNFMEYAVAGSPQEANAPTLRLRGERVIIGAAEYLAIIARQHKAVTDLAFISEAFSSLDSAQWNSGAVGEIRHPETGTWWHVTARNGILLPLAPIRFLRLRITGP